MKATFFFTLTLLMIFLTGCSNNESLFVTPIGSDPGNLCIENESGFLGSTVAGTSFDYTLTVRSCGGLNLRNLNFSLDGDSEIIFKGGVFPGEGGTCTNTLNTGESCSVVILFEPMDIRAYSSTVSISYEDDISAKSASKVLSADSNPILRFEYGTDYDFGNKFIGSTTNLRVRIENVGRVNAESLTVGNLSPPYSFTGGSYPGTGGSCGTSLNIGESCDLFISYKPTTNERHLQTITLDYINTGRAEANELALKAFGFRPAVLSVTDLNGYDFGQVSTDFTHTKTFRIDYLSGDVTASGVGVTGLAGPFSVVGGTCDGFLNAADGSCTLIIGFNSSVVGAFSDDFNFTWNTGLEDITIAGTLTADAQGKPVLSISDTSHDFGILNIGDSSEFIVTLSYDSGGIPATNINAYSLNGLYSRVGGTCGTSLPSGTCTIIVGFNPVNRGIYDDTFYISYNDTQTIGSFSVSLKGKTTSVVSFLSSGTFPDAVTNQSSEKIISLNTTLGQAPIHNNSVITGDFRFKGGSYPGTGGSCASTISRNCRLVLEFMPTADGVRSGNLALTYNDGLVNKTINLALTGTGTSPATLEIDDISFPSTPLYSSSSPTTALTVRNTSSLFASNLTASLPDGFIYRGGSYPGENGTCGTTLSAGSSCRVDVAFYPSVAKAYSEVFTLSFHDGVTTQIVTANLSGIGAVSNDLALSRYETLIFDTTYETYESTIETVIVNHGGGGTQATSLIPNVDTVNYTIVTHDCTSLSAGQSCTVQVKFTPQDFGDKSGTLTISYDSGGSGKTVSRPLSGRALETDKLHSDSYNVDLGNIPVGFSKTSTVTLSKASSEPPYYQSKAISGTDFSIGNSTCTISRFISSSCYIDVQINPSSPGSYSGNLSYVYDDERQNITKIVAFSANAVAAPKLTLDQSNFTFGPLIRTQVETKLLTLTNDGGFDLANFNVTISDRPFDYTGGTYPGTDGDCGSSLASGDSCTIDVSFAPLSVANFSETITVSYNNNFDDVTTTATLIGTSKAQAILNISGGSPYDLGTVAAGTTIEEAFTITNPSDVAATDIVATLPSNMTFSGGSFPGDGGTCSDTIDGASACVIVLRFTASNNSPYVGLFRLAYNDGLGVQEEVKEFNAN